MQQKRILELEELIENISDSIKLFIWKVFPGLNHLDKEDIEQEVKIKVWTLISSGKKIDNFPSYLKRVVNTTTIDLLRKKRRKIANINIDRQPSPQLKAPVIDHPDVVIERKELMSIIEEAVNSLSEKRKIVLKLYLTGMNNNEMADFLNWTPKKVEHLLYRGLNDVKKKFKKKGLGYETIR